MRDRRARCAFLALILALPPIIDAAASGGPRWAGGPARSFLRPGPGPGPAWRGPSAAAMPITGQVELLIVAGLMYAGVQRRRLLAGGLGPAGHA